MVKVNNEKVIKPPVKPVTSGTIFRPAKHFMYKLAVFEGTNGYYGSSATSSFYAADPVTPAPTEAPPTNLATTTDLMTYIAASAVAIIVAIALVGVLVLRKP